jgi:SAM-dependent methyltransferase
VAVANGSAGELRSVLDFGCGAGRVLPWFSELVPLARCSGCDVDESAIAWAQENGPGLSWSTSSFMPPLPYEAGSFELVFSISVFSHLEGGLQRPWLAEMRRVLAPGGVALLSIHGPHAFEAFRTGRVRTAWCDPGMFARPPLGADEFLFVPYERTVFNHGDLPGVGPRYGLAFHGPGHIRAGWGEELEVVAVQERALTDWQDLVVCRKARRR